MAPTARVIAFYLPQFHPIPENDEWWGPGFTEWTNVVRAAPLFPGHHQPHQPAHLGYYDLRVPEVREKQAELAARHGIEAFCYWHYWFHGKRLLERPFDEVLATGRPDLPFCLAWANEPWSRRWLGDAKDVMQPQEYSPEDDRAHAQWLTRAFADPRYACVDGRPIFLIYNPGDLPGPEATTATLRDECAQARVEDPFLIGVSSHRQQDWRPLGFDANLDFEPQLGVMPGALDPGLKLYDYAMGRQRMVARPRDYPHLPCVMVAWDNTPRRGEEGIVFLNATPETFRRGLEDAIESVKQEAPEQRLVFVNAWNEWAEGNHLEPDQWHGLAYLEAVAHAVGIEPAATPPLAR